MTFSAFQGCISLTTPTAVTTLHEFGEPLPRSIPYYVLEPYIPVAWDSADFPKFTPSSAPLSVKQACAAARLSGPLASTPIVDGAGAPGSAASSDGLSVGAKAGIGVGVAIAAVMAITMVVLLLKYRRKATVSAAELKKRNEGDTKAGVSESKADLVVTEAESNSIVEADHENTTNEADSGIISAELDSPMTIAEMEGSRLRHELDGGWRGYEK